MNSAHTTIRVPLSVLRAVLDVHAELLANATAQAKLRASRRGAFLRGAEMDAYLDRVRELEEEQDDLREREADALRAYYVATAGSLGVDTAHPGDEAARLESTIRLAAGGGQ